MVVHNIDLGYSPRPMQAEIHRLLGQKRFGIAICHRRFGKTVAAKMELVHRALATPGFEGGYVAPFLSQARRVFWGSLRETCLKIPGVECRETEMLIRFPNGSTIRCMGADSADGIRGLGFDFIILDEFADFEPTVLPLVILPTLAGRNGGLFIIGTRKRMDALLSMYLEKQSDPAWVCFRFGADISGVFTDDELKVMRDSMTDEQFRLEFLCDLDVPAPDQLIPGVLVNEAAARDYRPEDYRDSPRIIGCDIARQGSDFTVLARRQGMQCWDLDAWQSSDLMWTARKIRDAYYAYKADGLLIDGGGIGAGVVDALREMGVDVIEVQFGSKPSDPRFKNLRAEMWMSVYHWLRRGGRIPNDPLLKQELTTPLHFTGDDGKTQLESKDDMKKRGMPSPDRADALALTFAFPIHPKSKADEQTPKTDWDPFQA